MTELQEMPLPQGWDCRYDKKTGKAYYINHFTKTTTWDDPRGRYRSHGTPLHLQNVTADHIPMQHGSPDLRRNYVYPSQHSPIPAFQMPGQYSPKFIPLQEMRSNSRNSPLLLRTARTQDSSLTNVPDTDESVAKISSMFPTVSDTHIRLLLKKYHNREAVVISALQVEKHPITTPGPFATPPPARNIHPGINSCVQTPPLGMRTISRGESPLTRFGSVTTSIYTDSPRIGNSPRPHSSPKLKLRYMKSIFPKAEETIILDILSNNENNIQKASDALKQMGYERRDPAKILQQQAEAKLEEQRAREEELLRVEIPSLPKIKTTAEKDEIKSRLQEKYADIAERVISIALESVQFDEDRANQILQIMVQEDSKSQNGSGTSIEKEDEKVEEVIEVATLAPSLVPTSQSRQSLKSLLKSEKIDKEKGGYSRVLEGNNMNSSDFKSVYLSNTYGANPNLVTGPNEKLLLLDYVSWQGPNPDLNIGRQNGLAKGPDKSNLSNRLYTPIGPNSDLRKGPKIGLTKGSIFQQFRYVIAGDSRAQ